MSVIVMNRNDKSIVMDITSLCYGGCSYCYHQDRVSTKGVHLDFRTFKKRLAWLVANTDVEKIIFAGGEPGLHPLFIKMCNYVLDFGLELGVITSGKILPKSKLCYQNIAHLMKLYREGRTFVQLSYHPGRNDHQFFKLVDWMRMEYAERRLSLQALGKYNPTDTDLFTVVMIERDKYQTPEVYKEFLKLTLDRVGTYGFNEDQFEESYRRMLRHFVDRVESLSETWVPNDAYQNFRVKVMVRGAEDVTDDFIGSPSDSTCPAIGVGIFETHLEIRSVLIRMDGGLVFAHATCIDMAKPLVNIDEVKNFQKIFETISSRIKAIRAHVFLHNRLKAAQPENCDEKGNEKPCTGCPFDSMCKACWTS